ncbi:MAG TPA: hypothetical protein VK007_13440 [Acidimicrobiales bacterium]|nr:hypothetical protein [Acidimicrobiales bacterium]
MGQPITVVEKRSSNPAILRFETNRPLSGLDHERYTEPPSELLDRPVDELARRLFAHGGVEAVHINGAVVTVTLQGGHTGEGLADIIRGLFLHYPPSPDDGVAPPTDEGDRTPEMTADPGATPAAQQAEEPAAAEPPAPEAAEQPDAATTEPGTAPALADAPAEQPAGGEAEAASSDAEQG